VLLVLGCSDIKKFRWNEREIKKRISLCPGFSLPEVPGSGIYGRWLLTPGVRIQKSNVEKPLTIGPGYFVRSNEGFI